MYVDSSPESRNCDDGRTRRVVVVRGENRRERIELELTEIR